MLPFPIISNTNINPSPVMVKKFVVSSSFHQALLYSNGELYTKGAGTSYQLGTGNTTDSYSTWNLVKTGVADVFVGAQVTVVILNDGTAQLVGATSQVTGTTVANQQTWFDITSVYSTVGVTNIKDIQIGLASSLVLSNSNILYKIGLNSNRELGGAAGAVTTLTQITTSIQSCSLTSYTSFYITTAGVLWRCGINTSGQCGTGNTTNLTTFTQYSTSAVWSNVYAGDDTTLVIGTNASAQSILFVCGSRTLGQLGTGTTSTTPQTTFSVIGTATNNIVSGAVHSTQNNTILQSNGMFAFGYNNTGSLGTGNNINANVPTICIGVPSTSTSNIKFLSKITFRSTFFVYLDQLWGAGFSQDLMGTDSNVFIKISTPYN